MNKPPTLKNFFISGRGNHKSQNEMLLKLQEPYPSARKMLSFLPRYTPLINYCKLLFCVAFKMTFFVTYMANPVNKRERF